MSDIEPSPEPLDSGMLRFYEALNQTCPADFAERPLPEQRRAWDDLCRQFRAERAEGLGVTDRKLMGEGYEVPVRIYRPAGDGLLPGVIYFHGGGWVLGSLETHDDMCGEIALGANVAVVAVDSGRLIAAGDSAGGQMSAGLALWLRDQAEPQLLAQVLIYPVLGTDLDTPSYTRNAEAPCLTRSEMKFYLDSFLGRRSNGHAVDKYAVPLLESDFSGLPPAFITAAAHDPLYDDAIAYAERLRQSGVRAELRREPALAHSYMRARAVSEPARQGFEAIVEAIRKFAWPEPLG